MIIDLPKVIGHRGVKDLAPENTIPSLYEATRYNIKWIEVDVKIRYYSQASKAIINHENKDLVVNFKNPQLAITKGQSAVFYIEDELLGGGIIK